MFDLFSLADEDFKNFQAKLIPTINAEKIIGVRSPELKKLAKYFSTEDFFKNLPHYYLEENLIHAYLLNSLKNFDDCLQGVKFFLPHIDNWAVCDSLAPKIFAKHTDKLITEIYCWLESTETYTVRFALLMLLKFYLGDNFDKKFLQRAAEVQNKNYYVEMMTAWLFAEALVKQYDAAVIFLQENILPAEVHKMTIQKAVDSRRISADKKIYLKTLRR